MSDGVDYVWALVMLAFLVVGVLAFCTSSADCEGRGGVLVQTSDVTWACVQKR